MPEEPTDDAARDLTRIGLIVACVLAALLVALIVPTLGSDGIRGSPIDSVLPGEQFSGDQGANGEFGALNPGDSTGVGGETGFDKETFGNNDTEVHFEVESSEASYWRTGTYGTYTGTGWERNPERSPYDSPIGYEGLGGEELVYEVEFQKQASTLPTPWRPVSVSGVDGLTVTDTGSIETDGTVDPGTTFSGVSQAPLEDVDVLRSAGADYPDAVRERYTQLPEDTPARVTELTDQLTADDDNPYDTAKTVQNWLRSEKGYSLEASEQSDAMADTFIFEMQEGYCEYFATAMTAMLRTQGIPARYTVGYTTGQEVSENRYQVRGMNAHAWVEVYFPDVGWVRFDPTPGDSRLQTQDDTLESAVPSLEYNITEPGSPGEEFRPGQIRDTTDDDPDDPDEGDTDEPDDQGYDISLNQTAVPGLPVEVTVTFDGEPAGDIRVRFNGESVGVTGQDGTLVATVPETDELRITVARVDQTTSRAERTAPSAGAGGGGLGAGAGPRVTDTGETSLSMQEEGDNETVVDVSSEASVAVSGDTYQGTNVTIVATVEEVAIPDATVFLNGTPVAKTDSEGRATVQLPERAGNSTLAVERGSVFGEQEVTVQAVTLDVSTGLVPLPLTGVTVDVTADGDGVANAPVLLDGEQVTQTGPDGSATVRLPLANAATVGTTQDGLSRETTVSGLYRNAAALLAGLLLSVLTPVGLAYRRGYRLSDLRAGLRRFGTRLALFPGWLARQLGWLASIASRRVSKTLLSVARVLSGTKSPGELAAGFRAWMAAKRAALRRRLRGETRSTATASPDPPGDLPTLREAWNRFLAVLDDERAATRTPGELATAAVEHGLPREPVETLRDAFRDVEYGNRDGSEREARVLAAIEEIEAAADTRQDEAESPDTPGDESETTPAETVTQQDVRATDGAGEQAVEGAERPEGGALGRDPPAGGDE